MKNFGGAAMEKYMLTCDTAVDLNEEFLTSRNIPYVSFHFTLDDKDYTDDLGKTLSCRLYADYFSG